MTWSFTIRFRFSIGTKLARQMSCFVVPLYIYTYTYLLYSHSSSKKHCIAGLIFVLCNEINDRYEGEMKCM
jgi:hypothetical protein